MRKNTFFSLLSTDFGVQPYQRLSENIISWFLSKERIEGQKRTNGRIRNLPWTRRCERIMWHIQLAEQFWLTLTSQLYNQINSRCIFYKICLSALWKKRRTFQLRSNHEKKKKRTYIFNKYLLCLLCARQCSKYQLRNKSFESIKDSKI